MRVFSVRSMRAGDVPGVLRLQRLAFPDPFPEEHLWRAEHLARHLGVFPAGQFVALDDDGWVVGSASNTRISEQAWLARSSWDATVGGPCFGTFDPEGTTLYGADISVDPNWRGIGVGRALYDARYGLVRKLGLTRYGTGCRIPGYDAWARARYGSDGDYVREVVERRAVDPTLTPLLQYGLACLGVVEGYMADSESRDAAALLEWLP